MARPVREVCLKHAFLVKTLSNVMMIDIETKVKCQNGRNRVPLQRLFCGPPSTDEKLHLSTVRKFGK
jgi:hypothetical protein